MNRLDRILDGLEQSMRLVEIGASYNPVAPKANGWKTIIVDHADASHLREHYRDQNAARIEEVDVIWKSGLLHDAFPKEQLGTFDAVISSHSLEHIPDAVSFLQSCAKLIKPQGDIRLALPDKRYCFDFFSGLSTTGDMLAAYHNRDRVHTKRTSFNEVAYAVKNKGRLGWSTDDRDLDLKLIWPLDRAYAVFQRASPNNVGDYYDFHAWKFVPSSFRLIIEELRYLGFLSLSVASITDAIMQEFFVTLSSVERVRPSAEEFNMFRLGLLKQSVIELSTQFEAIAAPTSHCPG